MNTADKIQSLEEASAQVTQWKSEGKKVVFTNGCFDIVHLGHIDYLEKARQKGDKLVVGVNTDASVRRLKGEKRPVVPEYPRARMIAAFEFVDLVVLFEEDTPLRLIETLNPDILTKGSDYEIKNIVGAEFVLGQGGRVETLDLVEGYSTSGIIEKIKVTFS
ncbi:MAG: D-glycero-beta-D-manno-heptose 1-phosphate adenylyltransferase [Microscillaceae bacterium]|nr:D-glycero-beta-D-manno-heptose 1-phosphate adenylyltransferase [Microscillaceae bacterium]